MQISLSLVGLISGTNGGSPVDSVLKDLDGLLPLLAGQPAEAVGETVTTRGSLQIPGAPTPEVYIAALGPQMLRLAGRRTAGTLTWMTGPKTLAEHVGPTLREAAAEAGRPETAVRVAASLPVSVTDDIAAARARAAKEFVIYGQLPSYRAMLDREGFAGRDHRSVPRGACAQPRAAANQGRVTAQNSSGVTAVTGVRSTARRVRE
jgi:5,10-methylenetetrahydromethanopterin reductase